MWSAGGASSSLSGSSISISQASANGRSLSGNWWFTSATGSPALGSQSTLPTWIYLTRGNGPEIPTIANAKDPTKPDYVIGRFVYTVYNLSGTLDANLAGYPSAASATEVGLKSSAAYADTSGLGIGANALASWRNPVTGVDAPTFLEWAAGISRTTGTPNQQALAAAQSGHLSVVEGDQALLSRHDLLAMLSSQGLSAAAPYLTHFSRSLNAPSWSPESDATSPYTYLTSAEASTLNGVFNPNRDIPNLRYIGTTAATVIHYLDNGTIQSNDGIQSYNVYPGDAAVQRRFSLAKLAWLTYLGVKTGISATAVQSCFGLKWDSTNEQWDYVGSSLPLGSTLQTSIETLAQVAAEATPREPNFFEVLKAGILAGSIGLPSANLTMADSGQRTLDQNSDLQILRIGADIIDATTADNYPTTLVLAVGGTSIPVHGVKDLPYLYDALNTNLCVITGSTPTFQIQNLALVMVPELFNPHASSGTSIGPASIRVRIANGSLKESYASGEWPTGSGVVYRPIPTTPTLPTSTTPIVVNISSGSFSNSSNFRSAVVPITTATSATSLAALLPWATDSTHGFVLYNYTTGLPQTFPNTGAVDGVMRATLSSDIMMVVEYPSPTLPNTWRVYDTLCGNEALPTTTGLYNSVDPYLEFDPAMPLTTHTTLAPAYLAIVSKLDPRSTRLGAGIGAVYSAATPAPVPTAPESSNFGLMSRLPFGSGSVSGSNPTGIYPGLWPQGGKTGWSDTDSVSNVADPDAVVRPADGWLGMVNNLAAGVDNLFQSVSNTSHPARPVILCRPFRSVAELGYVFRDSPWKTLSFFDNTSGDGALLDLFSVSDEPAVSAGRANLNTPQPLVTAALLSQSGTLSDGSSPLSSTAPTAIANAFGTYAFNSGSPTASLPQTLADIPAFIGSTGIAKAQIDTLKAHQEALPRAFADSTQTRTWNLLIDVVAQTGRFPTAATGLDSFLVEGERRYWLSIAIDRLTGKVVDQQLEPADE